MDRAEQELYGASVHVNYEVEMLKAMTSFLCEFPERTAEGIWRRNAYLESFVLHVRNLIDFLYPPTNAKPDDILAEHHVRDVAGWKRRCPGKTKLLQDAEARVNELAAHLTYATAQLPKDWEFSKIQSDLWQPLQCFFTELPFERQRWFSTLSHESGR
jgi:hypothetical protein